MRRHLMPLAAFLTQTDPPALALRVVVLDAHGDDRANAGKGERHHGNSARSRLLDQLGSADKLPWTCAFCLPSISQLHLPSMEDFTWKSVTQAEAQAAPSARLKVP